jgi:hypothetical protein
MAPSTLIVTPENKVLTTTPAANIMDNKPGKNIPPFGMCTTQSNPAVLAATTAATTAAAGVYTPTPAPCTPVTSAPWAPGSPTVMIGNQPALNDLSKLTCQYGGVIIITNPGQTSVQVP